MKLNVKAFSLTCALLWGISIFAVTWWIIMFDGSTGEITYIGLVYRGYKVTPLGSFVGLIWAFFDGLIGGAIFSWLYNYMVTRCTKK
jgi:hypothetical protein